MSETRPLDDLIAGAFAGGVARLLTAPLDVLKIRFQLQSNSGKKYTSIIQSLKSIVSEEGFFSLWKGNISATFLWISYSMIQFTVYDYLKSIGESLLQTEQEHSSSKSSRPSGSILRAIALFAAGAGNSSILIIMDLI
jgi:solute carrier family 25 thiamine pyrophosphate transporter 19